VTSEYCQFPVTFIKPSLEGLLTYSLHLDPVLSCINRDAESMDGFNSPPICDDKDADLDVASAHMRSKCHGIYGEK
jgi:hypothetical protein